MAKIDNSTVIHVRIPQALKDDAEDVLKAHGSSVSKVVRDLMRQIADTKEIPDLQKPTHVRIKELVRNEVEFLLASPNVSKRLSKNSES